MNLKFSKILTYTFVAGFCILGFSMTADAQGFAGITAAASTNTATTATVGNTHSTFAGVSLAATTALADTAVGSDSNAYVSVANAEYEDVAICQISASCVNIRKEPAEDAEVVGKIYNNSAAAVLEFDDEWIKITSGSCTGYVKREFFVIGDESLAKSVSSRYAKASVDAATVYSDMSTSSEVLTQVAKDDDLTVLDSSMKDSGWVKVSTSEGDGYVSTSDFAITTSYTLAESKAEEEARLAKEAAEKKAALEAFYRAQAKAQRQAAARSSRSSSSSGSSRSYSSASGSGGSAVVGYGSQFVGNRYVYGGSSLTNGTDCSGFVMSVYGAYGVSLPHSSSAMRSVGYGVSSSEMQPGDIVCYSGHVGIYAGNGTLLHASNARTGITYSNVNYKPIVAVRRIY